jgi:hypothetical protein
MLAGATRQVYEERSWSDDMKNPSLAAIAASGMFALTSVALLTGTGTAYAQSASSTATSLSAATTATPAAQAPAAQVDQPTPPPPVAMCRIRMGLMHCGRGATSFRGARSSSW